MYVLYDMNKLIKQRPIMKSLKKKHKINGDAKMKKEYCH